jgi:predicted RecA/RadA family phage recombinase
MATNKIQDGYTVEYAAPYAVTSGQGALIGVRFGVAQVTLALNERGNFDHTGVHRLTKATGEAWAEGAALFWDNTNRRVTTTSSGNTRIGTAANAALSADAVGNVLLNWSA